VSPAAPAPLVLFGTGSPLSLAAWRALADRFAVLAVVVPRIAPPRDPRALARAVLRWRARRPLVHAARARGVPVWRFDHRLGDRIAAAAPELLCVASFPRLLPPSIRAGGRRGGLNIHPSLLPRHRGSDPLFWTYHAGDAQAGVSIHWLDDGADTGPLVAQEALALARGRPARDLYVELAERGSRLLVRAVADVLAGRAPRIDQDEARATRAPRPAAGTWRIDFDAWGAERLWHFLAGLAGYPLALLHDPAGRPLAHGAPLGFTLSPSGEPPGTIRPAAHGWRVACRDGVVDVAAPDRATRLRALVRRRRAAAPIP
jgi:methionyl-tRNA formyltransferase